MRIHLIAASVLLAASVVAQQVEPEVPSTWREVRGVIDAGTPPVHDAYFPRAHVPGFRTTQDGRVALVVEGNGLMRVPCFTLIKPEKTTTPLLLNPGSTGSTDTSFTMSWGDDANGPQFKWANDESTQQQLRNNFTDGVKSPRHACLWDPEPPTHDNGEDVYDFYVFVTTNEPDAQGKRTTQFFVTPVTVRVANPKTANATISSVVTNDSPIAGPLFSIATTGFGGSGFEPVIAGDGGLLVLRIASEEYTFTHPVTGVTSPAGHDVVYSYYDPEVQGTHAADPREWDTIYPITYAPDDARINGKFGFARQVFRDAAGDEITPGQDLGGSYPWIDRKADNLFFETIKDQLRYKVGSDWNILSRYDQGPVPGDAWYQPQWGENTGTHQGISFIGLWSHGKLVQVDNLLNDMDYAIGDGNPPAGPSPQARLVDLYEPFSDPAGTNPGQLALGYGRSTGHMPPGENDNANIIDSIENKLNANDAARFIRLQDIVWTMTSGRHTEEFAFDDYLDPDAVVVANMSGLLSWHKGSAASAIHGSSLKHHTSWDGNSWEPATDPVRLQNAATGTRWALPAYGEVEGPGRIEPAASGGVRGKGFWMDGTIGLRFDMPAQVPAAGNPDVADHDWYVGVFVDCRFDDDAVVRRLLTFPDGTALMLLGRSQVLFADATGAVVDRITIPPVVANEPDLLPRFGWAHLGLQVRDAGSSVDLHLNGMLYHRWTRHPSDGALFQMEAGALTLGKVSSEPEQGFIGWTDDLKVLAHDVDIETACNHAHATLIGLPAAYSGPWRDDHAARYPDWVHDEYSQRLRNRGEPSSPHYAPFHDYATDDSVHRDAIPAGTDWLRARVHFPEGPLFHDAPRPHSVANVFCLNCHHPAGLAGLDVDALAVDFALDAKDDPRRQPSQPPATVGGVIPAGFATNTDHALPQPPSQLLGPVPVDELMLTSYLGDAQVTSITLIDDTTGDDLLELVPGMVVDPGRLGTDQFALRANLDKEQGAVWVSFDNAYSINPSRKPPHMIPWTPFGMVGGGTPTSHTARGTGDSGQVYAVTFSMAGDDWRDVADYRDDFQPVSPKDGWRYRWNELGAVQDPSTYVDLFWTPSANRYAVDGLNFPTGNPGAFACFTPTGGHPGRGSNQTGTPDRFAIASYTTKIGGDYRIVDGEIDFTNASAAGNVGIVGVATIAAGVLTVHDAQFIQAGPAVQFDLPILTLPAGVEIIVAVGPQLVDTADSFSLDYAIEYRP